MAFGGGPWAAQDKVLPGTYTNFSSALKSDSSLSKRGIVAVPLALDWGPEKEVFTLTSGTVQSVCKELLGYGYADEKNRALRELFKNAAKLFCYRIGTDAAKASNSYATAKYSGLRGNDIKIAIADSVDHENTFDVTTYVGTEAVDRQTAVTPQDIQDNAWVTFKREAFLSAAAAVPLTGGSNGSAVSGADYTEFLAAIESYSFNILCCPTADQEITGLFTAFTKRLCDESGANFQTVCYKPENADYEGIIGVGTAVTAGLPEYGLVYWVAGAASACLPGASLTNRIYNGELAMDLTATQNGLKAELENGRFVFHNVNGMPRVLEDINSLKDAAGEKSEDFKYNQTIRVLSGISNDIAVLFNEKYLGVVPNNADGRISLWNDVCKVVASYEKLGAIDHMDTNNIEILPGESKKSVICGINGLSVMSAMSILYMNVIIA